MCGSEGIHEVTLWCGGSAEASGGPGPGYRHRSQYGGFCFDAWIQHHKKREVFVSYADAMYLRQSTTCKEGALIPYVCLFMLRDARTGRSTSQRFP